MALATTDLTPLFIGIFFTLSLAQFITLFVTLEEKRPPSKKSKNLYT